MEAVPATSGVRRTVRLAAALVIGQVLLVAIIGWVTVTRGDGRPARGPAAVDQLAAPPARIPPAPPATTRTSPAARATSAPVSADPKDQPATIAGSRDRSHTTPHTAPGAQARKTVTVPLPPRPAAPTTSAASDPLSLQHPTTPAATPSASVSASPAPVLAGLPCDKWNEVTRADDGRMVRCLPTRFHQLRWKIV